MNTFHIVTRTLSEVMLDCALKTAELALSQRWIFAWAETFLTLQVLIACLDRLADQVGLSGLSQNRGPSRIGGFPFLLV